MGPKRFFQIETPDLVGFPASSDDEGYEGNALSIHWDDTSLCDVLSEDELHDVPVDG